MSRPRPITDGAPPIVVTGGAGFIGSNLVDALALAGERVVVLDNLSRPGVEQNLAWLKDRHGAAIEPVIADIRNAADIAPAFRNAKAVFHFAAQTAVTTSLVEPVEDFEINARGTLNVLEAVRKSGTGSPVIFASTNKVYGGLGDMTILERDGRHMPADDIARARGIGEERKLDFCTPYGCSKGVADQYVLDYAHSYGLPTAVLRMSCIYGPRQFGTEDQGWLAHFLIRTLEGKGLTIYGDGKQVRDVLHVSDAVAAYRAALSQIGRIAGRAFNLGGGPRNAVSLNMVLTEIERLLGRPVEIEHAQWRAGDQLYFVADTTRLESELGWKAQIGWRDGVRNLADWLVEHRFPEHKSAKRASA